jgi:MFS family permease
VLVLAQYRAVLSKPGALGFSSAAWIGRMWLSMTNLGILLLISAVTRRYGMAGAVSATYVITGAVGQPFMGRLTDRLGQSRVLLPMVAVHAAGVIALLLLAENGGPSWSLFAAAIPTGLCCPPLGSQVRARWSALLGTGRALDTAYALESVLDELVFVLGPVLVTVLSTSIDPAAGLLTALAFTIFGTVAFALQRQTEPESGRPKSHASSPLRIPAIRVVCVTYTMVGTLFGSTDVTMVAFATQHGSRAYTGWLLALISGGSCIGGLVYGSRHWKTSPERRFTLTVSSLAFFALGVAVAPGLPYMAVAGVFMGVSIAPAIISSSLLIEKYCPADRLTEGFSLIGSSLGVGFAVGASVAGGVIDQHSTHAGFAVGTVAVAVAAAVAIRGRRVYRPDALTGPVHDDRVALTVPADC